MFGVKKSIGDVVKMTTARIHLPCLSFVHSPNLDDSIVCGRDDKREGRMEHCIVDPTIVTFDEASNTCLTVEKLPKVS